MTPDSATHQVDLFFRNPKVLPLVPEARIRQLSDILPELEKL
jgi:hypothetical protein